MSLLDELHGPAMADWRTPRPDRPWEPDAAQVRSVARSLVAWHAEVLAAVREVREQPRSENQ